jgi:hypothetical protein
MNNKLRASAAIFVLLVTGHYDEQRNVGVTEWNSLLDDQRLKT